MKSNGSPGNHTIKPLVEHGQVSDLVGFVEWLVFFLQPFPDPRWQVCWHGDIIPQSSPDSNRFAGEGRAQVDITLHYRILSGLKMGGTEPVRFL